jgi:tRNA A-37 threonylcarbamoyl transferase component Bud32
MPVPTNPVELLDWLQRHQLLLPEQANELRPLLPTFPEVRLLAKELIRRNWLTPFEVNQILTDKGDQLILGCYRLRERLGEGAMGQVFKAWNTRLQTVVAVKTLHKDLVANARAMDRFRQEIEAAGQLDHPNIVKVRDADEIDSRPFLVMDYIEGPNLSFRVKTQHALPIPMAAECARQAALGLQHAFERGVVHRDIKPANLLLELDPAHPEAGFCVKVLDFGLARFDSERRHATRLTQLGSTLGTVDFMAPEQAESARDADTRADIYALGCTLFFLLAGKPPFPGSSMAEKIGARLIGSPPSVREARPEVPEALDAVLKRMMARQPADRYQTPAEVADVLLPFTVAQPPVPDMPTVEIDRSILLAAPVAAPVAGVPLAQAIALPHNDAGSEVPLAQPIAADAPMLPWSDRPVFAESQEPFAGESVTTDAETPATSPAPKSQVPGKKGLDRRLIIGLAAGGAALFFLLIGCGGWIMVRWFGGGDTNPNTYPPGAELQISEAFLSSDELPIGSRKNVIVKIRRVKFNGDVELRLEDLPSGVTSSKTLLKAGSTAIEIPITASFGIEPSKTDIRIVGTAKNLTGEKKLRLHVIHDARTPKGP